MSAVAFSFSQDAHNCIPEFDVETAMFAVYDGHGGNADIILLAVFSSVFTLVLNDGSPLLKTYMTCCSGH